MRVLVMLRSECERLEQEYKQHGEPFGPAAGYLVGVWWGELGFLVKQVKPIQQPGELLAEFILILPLREVQDVVVFDLPAQTNWPVAGISRLTDSHGA